MTTPSNKDTGCLASDKPSSIAEDRLGGVAQIATFTGETVRRTQYLLERGLIPAGKVGNRWVASKRRLREHFAALTAGCGA